jgi:hypothetical protein
MKRKDTDIPAVPAVTSTCFPLNSFAINENLDSIKFLPTAAANKSTYVIKLLLLHNRNITRLSTFSGIGILVKVQYYGNLELYFSMVQ